jgi:hypothetical protein
MVNSSGLKTIFLISSGFQARNSSSQHISMMRTPLKKLWFSHDKITNLGLYLLVTMSRNSNNTASIETLHGKEKQQKPPTCVPYNAL